MSKEMREELEAVYEPFNRRIEGLLGDRSMRGYRREGVPGDVSGLGLTGDWCCDAFLPYALGACRWLRA